jgi:ribosome-associated translation inhibitor RaiA
MFEAIDLAADKLDRQFSRDKSKRKHHKGHQGSTPHEIG